MKRLCVLLFTFFALSVAAQNQCIVEGNYSLQLEPYTRGGNPLWLSGYIGHDYITWHILFVNFDGSYEISENYRGAWIRLKIERDRWSPGQMRLFGTIGGNYIQWMGYQGWFNGITPCLK